MPQNFTAQERQALLNALNFGRANAIGARPLAIQINFPISSNQIKLRSLIKECIEIDGDLIGATTGKPADFFKIVTIQELDRYLDSLEQRTRSDNDRRTALINNWNTTGNLPITTRNRLTIT